MGKATSYLLGVLRPWHALLSALQEKPEDVPTGELPRTVSVLVDRHLVNKTTPGTRVNVVGIYSTFRVSPGCVAGQDHVFGRLSWQQ